MKARHYRVQQFMDIKDVMYLKDNPQILKILIENRILQDLRPLIWDNLKVEKDISIDKYRYSLDIYMGVEND